MAKKPKAQKVGYKSPPKAHQWQPGQSGNPSGKKKAANKPPQTLPEILETQLGEVANITLNGKSWNLPLSEILVRKFLHNFINGPLKVQIEGLKFLDSLGVYDPPDYSDNPQEDPIEWPSPEHLMLLKITKDALKDCDLDK